MGGSGDYLHNPTEEELRAIRTRPGKTVDGKSFDDLVQRKIDSGDWRLECVRPDLLGLDMPLEILRATRRTRIIKPWPAVDDAESYCPAHWADLAIGRGPCGLRCRVCFLIMTHRMFCDPSRHIVYENVEDHERAVQRWLKRPNRKNMGLGIDCSDSLLYEGVTGHARRLIPLFASPETNPHSCRIILLTKSCNVRFLEGMPTDNVLLTFSLNPHSIADLWEGKFTNGKRVTPTIEARLSAAMRGQDIGFETRWRVDPIFPVPGWREIYTEFFRSAAERKLTPSRITLGTYRETQHSLRTFSEKWGLPPLEWAPEGVEKDGAHYHLGKEMRVDIYRFLVDKIRDAWGERRSPIVALCKEPKNIRKEVGIDHDSCNCC